MPFFKKAAKTIEIAIEYYAPHWILVIRNPGQKHWAALRSKSKMIITQDEFGLEVGRRPAIESFPNLGAAQDWIRTNMGAELEPVVRDASAVRDFQSILYGEKMGHLSDRVDVHASKPYARAKAGA